MFNIIIKKLFKESTCTIQYGVAPYSLRYDIYSISKFCTEKKNCSITILVCLCHRCHFHHNHNYCFVFFAYEITLSCTKLKEKLSKYISRVSFDSHSKNITRKLFKPFTLYHINTTQHIKIQNILTCFIKKINDFNLKRQD